MKQIAVTFAAIASIAAGIYAATEYFVETKVYAADQKYLEKRLINSELQLLHFRRYQISREIYELEALRDQGLDWTDRDAARLQNLGQELQFIQDQIEQYYSD